MPYMHFDLLAFSLLTCLCCYWSYTWLPEVSAIDASLLAAACMQVDLHWYASHTLQACNSGRILPHTQA